MSYDHDYTAFGELVLCAPWMVDEMKRRADAVADIARAEAPVGPEGDPHRGLYRDSFEVTSGIQERGTRRAYGEVANTAPYAIDVEYGNRTTPKYRTLGKALDAARL